MSLKKVIKKLASYKKTPYINYLGERLDVDFFKDRLIKHPNGCWTIPKSPYGRSSIRFTDILGRCKTISLQKYFYELKHGDIGRSQVYSTCGNPDCCNPNHTELARRRKGDFVDAIRDERELKDYEEIISISSPEEFMDILESQSKAHKDGDCWMSDCYTTRVDGINCTLTRLMYKLKYGKLPMKGYLAHTCGCDTCINPNHLKISEQSKVLDYLLSKGGGKYLNRLQNMDEVVAETGCSNVNVRSTINYRYDRV